MHCVEVKSAVDVEMFTALPDSTSSLFTTTQTAIMAVRAMVPIDDAPARAFWAVLLRVSKLNSRLN